jgi:hypothetical protein
MRRLLEERTVFIFLQVKDLVCWGKKNINKFLLQVKHGNEDTLREMLRIKRSVQATYNTQVTAFPFVVSSCSVSNTRTASKLRNSLRKNSWVSIYYKFLVHFSPPRPNRNPRPSLPLYVSITLCLSPSLTLPLSLFQSSKSKRSKNNGKLLFLYYKRKMEPDNKRKTEVS